MADPLRFEGLPEMEDGESLMGKFDGVELYFHYTLHGEGMVFVTSRRVIWAQEVNGVREGFQLRWEHQGSHTHVRGRMSLPKPHVMCFVSREGYVFQRNPPASTVHTHLTTPEFRLAPVEFEDSEGDLQRQLELMFKTFNKAFRLGEESRICGLGPNNVVEVADFSRKRRRADDDDGQAEREEEERVRQLVMAETGVGEEVLMENDVHD